MKVANEKEAFWIKPSVRLLFTTLEYRFTPTCNEKRQPEQTAPVSIPHQYPGFY